MILLGCLLAFSIAVAPRVMLILAWIFSDRWHAGLAGRLADAATGHHLPALHHDHVHARLEPRGGGGSNIEGWDWMWILLGVFLDISKWMGLWGNRNEGHRARRSTTTPAGRPAYGGAWRHESRPSVSGQVPPSTSPTAPDATTAPRSDGPRS